MRPRISMTSNQSRFRRVLEARFTPWEAASANDFPDVPTSSTILYVLFSAIGPSLRQRYYGAASTKSRRWDESGKYRSREAPTPSRGSQRQRRYDSRSASAQNAPLRADEGGVVSDAVAAGTTNAPRRELFYEWSAGDRAGADR